MLSGFCSSSATGLLGSIRRVLFPTETPFLFHAFVCHISLVCQIYKAKSTCFVSADCFAERAVLGAGYAVVLEEVRGGGGMAGAPV